MGLEINTSNVPSERLRNITQECLSNIFNMLGEMNFKRWINKKRIAEQLKSLIIEYMTED